LGHYAASRQVAGSISDEADGFFSYSPDPSSSTKALVLTQSLTEIGIWNFSVA
jgi:hypothetical protein